MSKGLVYFIVTPGTELMRCKIGFTAGEPNKRLQALQGGSPLKLAIYCAFDGTKETEKLFHQTFAPLRVHGEWFDLKGKLLDFLLCLMDDAETRRPADWVNVLSAIEAVVLAEGPFRKDDQSTPEEYAASADPSHWKWMADILAIEDAEGQTIQ